MSTQAALTSSEARTTAVLPERRPPRAAASLVATAKIAAWIAVALTLAVLAIGLAVDIAAIAPARRLLAFQFRGVPAEPAVAATVFVHNLHALLAIGGALLVAQMPYLVGPRSGRRAHPADAPSAPARSRLPVASRRT